MIETSARLLALLSLLQMRREWTGAELAQRLGVGPRTIRRDIEKLRSLGYPVEAAPGVAGGYRLGAGAELPPLLLDDQEAIAVAVGLRTAAAGQIAGIEETSVRALAKLEQILPDRLRRQVSALSQATSAFAPEGPRIDPDVLAGLAIACRDSERVCFAYLSADERSSRRQVDPAAVVCSGLRWYLIAYDLDREDWRTFRLDRITSAVRPQGRGSRRTVPGGDPAAYVQRSLRARADAESDAPPGRIRVHAPAERVRDALPGRWLSITPEGDGACLVSSRGPWSRHLLLWTALLDAPLEILDPPEMVQMAAQITARLGGR